MPISSFTNNSFVAPYSSDLLSGFDIYKPEKLNKLFRVKGDQGMSYFMLLKSLGFETAVARDLYSHYEEMLIHDTVPVNAQAGGAAGATVTLTINAAGIDVINGVNRIFPRLWDTILFSNGVTASVVAVNVGAATFDVRPNVSGDSIPATSLAEEIVVISNAFSEGSDQPSGRLAGTKQYTNYLQIIKESLNATGSEMTNQDWFDELVDDSGAGKKILGYVMKGQVDLDYRLALSVSNALLFQKATTNTITDGTTNRAIQTTNGLIPEIRTDGNVLPYTPGTFNIATFDDIVKIQDAEFCGNDIVAFLGIDLHLEIENVMVDYFKETEIGYTVANVFKGDEGLAMSVGFKSFRKGDRTFHFKRMGSFSHPKIGGAPGYNYRNMGMFLPIDMRKDRSTGDMIPSIGCRYKSLGKYSRKMETWNVSGAGDGMKVISNDLANWYMRTHVGAHHIGLNRFVLLDPQ
jgi:hypothetical protein